MPGEVASKGAGAEGAPLPSGVAVKVLREEQSLSMGADRQSDVFVVELRKR